MEKHGKSLKEPGKLQQLFAAIVVNLSSLSYGTMIGWQSPSAPQLQNASPPIGSKPMTNEGVSWLSGTMCLGGMLLTVLLLVIPDKFSRKKFGYVVALPLALSWLLIIFATEHTHIYIARTFCGIGGASVLFFVTNYVSEISSDSIRGMLASITIFAVNSGILLMYVLGGILSLRALAIVGLTIPILYIIAFTFMPESPVYLVRQNRIHEAARSLKWLKAGDDLVTERTLSHLQLEIKKTVSTRPANLSDLFRDKATIKGLIINMGLFSGQQFCGIFAMITYTETIFKMAQSSLTPNMSAIIVGAIQLAGSCLSTSLMERAGRRPLLFISCVGMCVCHCVIGVYCYLQDLQYEVSAYGWVPIMALSIFVITYALGMGSGPIVVVSEIFSRDLTTLAVAVGFIICWFTAFIIVKTFADLVALLRMYGCFFLFAASCACSFFFCFFLVPETKGRMREEIVDELNNVRCTKNIIGLDSVNAVQV